MTDDELASFAYAIHHDGDSGHALDLLTKRIELYAAFYKATEYDPAAGASQCIGPCCVDVEAVHQAALAIKAAHEEPR